MDHPHHQPAPDNHQDSDDDDDLYYDPNAKTPPAANPDEPRFIMRLPAPSRPNNYLPRQAPPAHLRQTRHDLEDREAIKRWLDQRYPPQPVSPASRPHRENAEQWRMLPDNVYGDVPPTEAWRKQDKEICHDQQEEAAAREPSPMEASLLRAELPIRESSPMREDDPDVVIDSLNWISQ
jgi:hypothetical protein